MARFKNSLAFASLLAGLMIAAAPAAMAGPWLRLESAHAVIYSDNGEKKVRDYALHMEVFNLASDKMFAEIGDTHVEIPRKQTFYYMEAPREFKLIRPAIANNAFSPELGCPDYGRSYFSVMQEFNNRSIDDRYINADLAYLMRSYTGIKIEEYFSKAPPVWLKAGLQDYFMTMNIVKGDVVVGLPLPDMMADENYHIFESSMFYPIDDIISGEPMRSGNSQVARVEQWTVVSHLMSTPEGRAQLADYLDRLRKSENKITAFHAATGLDDAAVRAIYDGYVHKNVPFLTYHFDVAADGDMAVTRLPDYGQDVPLMLAAVRTCPPRAQGETLLGDLRALSTRFPQDGLVGEATALAEIDFGDPEHARANLDRRLAANPQDVEALLEKARMIIAIGTAAGGDVRTARYTEARDLLTEAQTLDPGNIQIAYALKRLRGPVQFFSDGQAPKP